MNKSESIKELASALSKAQGEMTAAKMTSENPFYKSKYADLGEVITAAKAPLAKNGLSFSQHVLSSDGTIGVETILMHNSGEWLSSDFHLPLGEEKGGKSLAQSAGSIITYLRRYTLSAILGVYADEDTDGSDGKKEQAKPQPKTQPTYPKEARQVDDEENEPTTFDYSSLPDAVQQVRNSEGLLYTEISSYNLQNMLLGISKAVKANSHPEKAEEYAFKSDAIKAIIKLRQDQGVGA